MDAAHFEKTLSSEVLFEGRVVTLTKDVALLENGETSIRVEHLPEELQSSLEEGIALYSDEELYEFLENYSS